MMTRNARRTGSYWIRAAAVLAVAAIVPAATAGSREREREHSKCPGLVDGSKFMDYADQDQTLIEVNIRAPLLKLLAKAVHHDDEHAAELLSQIEAVSAMVISVGGDTDGLRDRIRKITEQLERDDWDHIARIKEDDTLVNVLALYDEDAILGLVVMVFDQSGPEFIFANIAGRLDMELMGSIGAGFGIPGLEELSGLDWEAHHGDHE